MGIPAGNGADVLIFNFINDIASPAAYLISGFCYVSATILLIIAIIRLTHTAQEGPRGPTGLGTIMTFLASSALFEIPGMTGTFNNSIF